MPPAGKDGDKEGDAAAAPKAKAAPEEEKKDPNEEKEEAKAAAAEPGASSVLENRPKKEKTPSEKGASKLSDSLMVQMNGIDAFTPSYNDAEAHGGYDRQTPERFAGERDDSLMRSLINNYSIELKNKDGSPSGNFFLDNSGAKEACQEVLKNNSHLS